MKIFVYFLTNIYWSMIISVCPEAPKVFFFTVSLSVHAVYSFIPCSIAPSVISCSCSPLSLPLTITAALSFFWPSCFTLLFSITIFQSSLSPHSISSLSFPLHPFISLDHILQVILSLISLVSWCVCVDTCLFSEQCGDPCVFLTCCFKALQRHLQSGITKGAYVKFTGQLHQASLGELAYGQRRNPDRHNSSHTHSSCLPGSHPQQHLAFNY